MVLCAALFKVLKCPCWQSYIFLFFFITAYKTTKPTLNEEVAFKGSQAEAHSY